VPGAEIVKATPAKDRYVVVTDEDFDKARVPGTQTFNPRLRAGHLDRRLYFTQPTTGARAGGRQAVCVLRDALAQSGACAAPSCCASASTWPR